MLQIGTKNVINVVENIPLGKNIKCPAYNSKCKNPTNLTIVTKGASQIMKSIHLGKLYELSDSNKINKN